MGDDCEKIILFGSYAYRVHRENSDYDVFLNKLFLYSQLGDPNLFTAIPIHNPKNISPTTLVIIEITSCW